MCECTIKMGKTVYEYAAYTLKKGHIVPESVHKSAGIMVSLEF